MGMNDILWFLVGFFATVIPILLAFLVFAIIVAAVVLLIVKNKKKQ